MLKHMLSGTGLLAVVGVLLLAPAADARPYVGVQVGYGGVGVRVGGYYHPGYYGHYHYPRYYGTGWGVPWYYGTFYSNPSYYSNYYVGPTYVPPIGYYGSPYYTIPSVSSYQSFYPPAAPAMPYASSAPAQNPNTVLVNVRLPDPNAQVLIDGTPTTQQGTNRQFISPPLTPGSKYSYEIEARWKENGKEVSQKRKVPIQAGQTVSVDFTKP